MAFAESVPRHEAERLLSLATGRTRSELLLGVEVDDDQLAGFRAFVERRLSDEPLQYIEGSVPFGSVEIGVDDRVLIPRPETEYLLEKVVGMVTAPRVIVDLCTGSGNLALALKAAFPSAEVHATDTSKDAATVARANADRNGLEISIHVGDLFDALPVGLAGTVDLLVANPPYLGADEVADLPADVLKEPRGALVSGPRGDEIVRRIAHGVDNWLAPGGTVAVEVSEFHASAVVGHFASVGGYAVKDLSGRDRFVFGTSRVE